MPIYEFRCKSCEHIEEILQKVNDPAPGVCPSCGKKNTMAKVVSHTSFQLKGGGWYSDLYGSTPKTGGTSNTSSAPSTTEKVETKAPASTETKKPD
jgi:putative FmdB family regulatory protein